MNIFKRISNKIKAFIDYYFHLPYNNINNNYEEERRQAVRDIYDVSLIYLVDEIIKEKNIPMEHRSYIIQNVLNRPVGGRWEMERYHILKRRINKLIENHTFILKQCDEVILDKDCQSILAKEFLTKEDMEI